MWLIGVMIIRNQSSEPFDEYSADKDKYPPSYLSEFLDLLPSSTGTVSLLTGEMFRGIFVYFIYLFYFTRILKERETESIA